MGQEKRQATSKRRKAAAIGPISGKANLAATYRVPHRAIAVRSQHAETRLANLDQWQAAITCFHEPVCGISYPVD